MTTIKMESARGGYTTGHMRYVLRISLALVIAEMIVVLAFV